MKTLEFKLSLNSSQEATINEWLNVQRWVWNKALSLTESFYSFRHYNKHDKSYAACSPIGWEYRIYQQESEKKYAPFCRIAADTRDYKPAYCSVDYEALSLANTTHFGLLYYFAQKNHPDKPWFQAVPSKFVAGTVKALADAWSEYFKGSRKHPKYKSRRFPIQSLINNNSKDIKVTGRYIRIPRLGKLNVKGLDERWNSETPISVLKICKRASGYYLQLTGDAPEIKSSGSDKAIGIDVGTVSVYTDDKGNHITPKKYYRKLAKRLTRLQRKIAKQQKGSANQKKSYKKLARLHEKTKLQRRAFNHKLSTKLVREYGAIAVEDIRLANLNRRPKKKERDDGKGYAQNGAKRKAGLNKSFADAAIGQLLTIIEQKAKAMDREFVRVSPHHTSQTCNKCGHCEPGNRPTQSKFLCLRCGHSDHADVNAAKNILARGVQTFARSYRTWVWDVKPEQMETSVSTGVVPVEDAENLMSKQMKQEATAVAPSDESFAPTYNQFQDQIKQQNCAEHGVYKQPSKENQLPAQMGYSFEDVQEAANIRATAESSITHSSQSTLHPRKSRKQTNSEGTKRTSAQGLPENTKQLTIWDVAPETDLESG